MLVGSPEFIVSLFAFCFGLHLLFDFGLQTPKEAEEKKGLNSYMLSHAFKTSLAISPAFLFFPFFKVFLCFLILFLSHLFLDNFRNFLIQILGAKIEKKNWWFVLGLDQILHLAVFWALFLFLMK